MSIARVGLLAVSGVRVYNERLIRLGVTLPGFVERARVIASMPSLGLLTLAAATPDGYDLTYLETPEFDAAALPLHTFDIVAISSSTAKADVMYAIADFYRAQGTTVVLGGLTGARNVKGGLLLLSVGLAAGLAMSVYAFTPMVPVPAELAHYDDLPRRLIRLAHIAAIMLPLINVVLGPWLDRVNLSPFARQAASWLLLTGAAGLPLTLALEALMPIVIPWHLSALPALAFCLAVFVTAAGAFRTDFTKEVSCLSGEDGRLPTTDVTSTPGPTRSGRPSEALNAVFYEAASMKRLL